MVPYLPDSGIEFVNDRLKINCSVISATELLVNLQMKLHEILQFAAATIPIVAVIWQIAEMKNQFYKYVDSNNENQNFRIAELEKNLAIIRHSWDERKMFVDYQFHGLNEKLDHKYQRLANEIKELQRQ